MINTTPPLVSCLCLTNKRPRFLKRAIECFLSQTYSNKELIVMIRDNDRESKEVIEAAASPEIHCFEYSAEENLPLGDVRNLSIEKSAGEYFCQWDDDDWYHERRVEDQVMMALNTQKPSCVLSQILVFNSVSKQAFMSGITIWPQTILCKKNVINSNISYPGLNKNEDTLLLDKLLKNNHIFPFVSPTLYLYNYHGNNTYNFAHFNSLFSSSQQLSTHVSRLFTSIMSGSVSCAEGSNLLRSAEVLQELNYLHHYHIDVNHI